MLRMFPVVVAQVRALEPGVFQPVRTEGGGKRWTMREREVFSSENSSGMQVPCLHCAPETVTSDSDAGRELLGLQQPCPQEEGSGQRQARGGGVSCVCSLSLLLWTWRPVVNDSFHRENDIIETGRPASRP